MQKSGGDVMLVRKVLNKIFKNGQAIIYSEDIFVTDIYRRNSDTTYSIDCDLHELEMLYAHKDPIIAKNVVVIKVKNRYIPVCNISSEEELYHLQSKNKKFTELQNQSILWFDTSEYTDYYIKKVNPFQIKKGYITLEELKKLATRESNKNSDLYV